MGDDKVKSHKYQWQLVCVVFFLSGAAGLIYEISWSRQIGLLFGHTIQAASIVLASYFSGMAVGYWLGASWSNRVAPLKGYAIAEFVVAGWAFMIPIVLGISEATYFAQMLTSQSAVWQTALRAGFSFLLLLPGTIALGVTLPMMAAYFSNDIQLDGPIKNSSSELTTARIAFAYAINTAGAFVGVLVATFGLLVFVGVSKSSYLAAGLSVVCGTLTLVLNKRFDTPGVKNREPLKVNGAITSKSIENESKQKLWLALSVLSGFGTLALQVLYSRMFSLVFHNSTYTFGIVVAVFLASLAAGAGMASALQKRFCVTWLVGLVAGLGAIATASSVILFVSITELKYFSYGNSFATYITGSVGLVAIVVAPAVACLGAMLPLVWKLAGANDSAGEIVGQMTAANTIAAALGALIASFCLLPFVGLWQSIVFVAVLFLMAGLSLLLKQRSFKTSFMIGLLFILASSFALSSPIDTMLGGKKYQEQLIKRWQSSYGWIDVVQRTDTGAMKVRQNLHYRFGATGNNAREYRQAHIPLLLHPNPKEVLFMGLGTGLTAGGAVPHDSVQMINAVELIPEVIDAARFLADHNYNLVDHEKVTVHVDDARHHLLATSKKYDVIISDLFVPWESESGYLYTVEHYQVALKRMNEGGLFCQWLPLYQVGEREFESIANSFATVFPETSVWWGQMSSSGPVIALIGTNKTLKVDSYRLDARLRGLWREIGTVDSSIATPQNVWDHYIGDWDAEPSLKRNPYRLNTDEHPRVEFLTPISIRNRRMIQRESLDLYFEKVLSKLTSTAVLSGAKENQNEKNMRHDRQRARLSQ
ncbi:MAG: fused MFS/spermidine synthase [Mariniblastus sp.]